MARYSAFGVIAAAAMIWAVKPRDEVPYTGGVLGQVRVQFLSPTLVRVEKKGPKGFEGRATFTVPHRPKASVQVTETQKDGLTTLRCGDLTVRVPDPNSLAGIEISRGGEVCYRYSELPKDPAFFPAPMPKSIPVADAPRIVPPKWGAAMPPKDSKLRAATLGWDLSNQAEDIYVFLPSDYPQFRQEFLNLTGPVEMPPLYYFGLWHSRYHPYTDKEALGVIDQYRKLGIPLDGFVVDTDWRVGASHGYRINTKLFPDMAAFIREAHARHARLMYNDHPEPVSKGALDREEMEFRSKGLASLLNMGIDVWWYDRNWSTHLAEPAPGLRKEVWGSALFHDITQQVHPDRRPLVMSNVPGIDNGRRNYAPHPAAHRYSTWWTGDTVGNWDYLKSGVANAVDAGVESLLPYLSEDLGGHFGNPTPEVYARFVEYGALSPMMRLHCTSGEVRDPWEFGPEAEAIVRDYTNLRYRLMPTFYAAAHRNYEDGTPLLRRCDLEWPDLAEAQRSDQYLLGDNLLVAPVMSGGQTEPKIIPTALLSTPDGKPGLKAEYFANKDLRGEPAVSKVDTGVDFNWGFGSPDKALPNEGFSIRWTGQVGPVPEAGEYEFYTRMDDGVRLWLDGKKVIDEWRNNHLPHSVKVTLAKGQKVDLRLEYFNDGQEASAQLGWILPSAPRITRATRDVWVPPGQWRDLWSGETVSGPKVIPVDSDLRTTPMWVRSGALVLTGEEMAYTAEKPWSTLNVEAFPQAGAGSTSMVYEDDGETPEYRNGRFAATPVHLEQAGNEARLTIGRTKGSFTGQLSSRSWTVRLHLQSEPKGCAATLDGKTVPCQVLPPDPDQDGYMPLKGRGPDRGGWVVECRIPEARTSKSHELRVRFG